MSEGLTMMDDEQQAYLIQMSKLVDLAEEQDIMQECPRMFKIQLQAFLNENPYGCDSAFCDMGNKMSFCMNANPKTLPAKTQWNITLMPTTLKLTLSFVDPGSGFPLHVTSERLKIQLSSYLRTLNRNNMPQLKLYLQPGAGIVYCDFSLSWQAYRKLPPGKVVGNIIGLIVKELRKCIDEISFFAFIDKTRNHPQKRAFNHLDHLDFSQLLMKINKYRFLLCETRLRYKRSQELIRKLEEAPEQSKPNREQVQKAIHQYFQVLEEMNQFSFGIKQVYQSGYNKEEHFFKELRIINGHKNSDSKFRNDRERAVNEQKIVWGIRDIKAINDTITDIGKNIGVHSTVKAKMFSFTYVSTINSEIAKNYEDQFGKPISCNKIQAYLAFKNCPFKQQSSRNSFLNEIKVLEFLRDKRSTYVPRYYLQLKDSPRSADETIYMRCYSKNLLRAIKQSQAMNLATRAKLAFRICKGLCFLSENHIVHRDIKPQNIVVDKEYQPKIIDFGSAVPQYRYDSFKVYDNRPLCTEKFHIRFDHLSLETQKRYKREQYDQHSLFDVYSLGKTFCYLFFGDTQLPIFEERTAYGADYFMENIIFLIKLCLKEDPDDRPGFGEIAAFLEIITSLLDRFRNPFH